MSLKDIIVNLSAARKVQAHTVLESNIFYISPYTRWRNLQRFFKNRCPESLIPVVGTYINCGISCPAHLSGNSRSDYVLGTTLFPCMRTDEIFLNILSHSPGEIYALKTEI